MAPPTPQSKGFWAHYKDEICNWTTLTLKNIYSSPSLNLPHPLTLFNPSTQIRKKLKTDLKCSQAEHFPNKVLFSNKKLCEKHMDWILQPSDDLKSCKLE